ncbi:hypothetical protein JCM10369A_21850 [Nocardioides pyridinolyticus]
MLLVVVVTNGFSAAVAGTLFASTSVLLILESVAFLGTDTGLVRWLPVRIASGRAVDLRRTLVVAVVPVAAVSVVLAAGLWAAAPLLGPHLAGSDAAPTMTPMLRALAVVLPVAALHDLVMAGTRGVGSFRPTVLVEDVGRIGLQAVGVVVVYAAGGGPTWLAVAWALPYVPGLVVGTAWLRVLVRRRITTADAPAPWWLLCREFWSYTSPRAIARVTQTALKRSDIVLVAALASPADAALYTAATRFVALGQLFVQSVQQALAPQLSGLFARGETRAANAVFRAATRWSMAAAWPLYLVTAGFAPVLMLAFGEGYDAASDVVVVLSVTMLLATACGPVDAVLLMAGRSWLSLANSTAALVVNVGLNLVLIPAHGIRGAAAAWAVAIVVRNLLPLFQVRRHLGMWPLTAPTVRLGLGALASVGMTAAVVAATDLPLAVDVAVTGAGLAAYLYGVWRRREALGLEVFGTVLRRRPDRRAASAAAGI